MKWLATLCMSLCLLSPVGLADVDSGSIGGDFSLTDHHGETFRLQDVRGKVVLLFFGYTYCPDVCPDSLGKIAKVLRELEGDAAQVQALFISVDPERDTVEKLRDYAPFFSPALLGLTGTPEAIRQVTDAYHAQIRLRKKDEQDSHYAVDHTASIYVLDRAGKVSSIIPFGFPAEHILDVVRNTIGINEAESTSARLEALPEKTAAPVMQLADMQGKPYRLQDHTGKPVLINLWASWCPPCRAELPSLNRAYPLLSAEGVTMLALNVGENQAAVANFLRDYPIDFPVLLDESGASMRQWPVKGLPTTFLLDGKGNIVYRATGEREWDSDEVLEQLRSLLKQASG